MRRHWILVANTERARVYAADSSLHVREHADFINVDGHDDSIGCASEAVRPPTERGRTGFARSVAGYLNRRRISGDYDSLHILAESDMMLRLRKEMRVQTRRLIVEEVEADMVNAEPETIASTVQRMVAVAE